MFTPTRHLLPLAALACLVLQMGCSRTHYRLRADRNAKHILHQKSDGTPWQPPPDYTIYPNPASRWHDPTPTDAPCLPVPAPQLYTYPVPEMPQHDPARFRPNRDADGTDPAAPAELPDPHGAHELKGERLDRAIHTDVSESGGVVRASVDIAFDDESGDSEVEMIPAMEEAPTPSGTAAGPNSDVESEFDEERMEREFGGRAPIPAPFWEPIPANCLRWMLEFEPVRDEYRYTFGVPPRPEQLDQAPRLALEDIIHQASLNSRELQTQKEVLYRVALALSLERFDYQLKPSVGGNNTAVDYTHDRVGGITVNSLVIPSNLQMEKMLCTGGDLLARFANSVILTFNGPNGFAADVGSDLLFDISQTVFQRDVRLEGLTQSERDVVYAARDFARFRRELFVDLASEYYALIRAFRQVEIGSQNYFTQVREFNQREAELRAGDRSVDRVQVDQVEQSVITGRRNLLQTCNGLENAIDNLKISIGLPTEEPLNLDLTELVLLTKRDELAVTGKLIERSRRRLISERNREFPAQASLLSAASVLVERMQDSVQLREQLGDETPDAGRLVDLGLRIKADTARLDVNEARQELQTELDSESPSLAIIFQRRMDVVTERMEVIQFQLQRTKRLEPVPTELPNLEAKSDQYRQVTDQLGERFDQLISDLRLADVPQLLVDSEQLEKDTAALVEELDKILIPGAGLLGPEHEAIVTIPEVDTLLEESESYLASAAGGLIPIDIDMDDAMMTALVRRFDLINERGALADSWRQIKIAADDLKSILNLRATQRVRTRSDVNRAFDFTLDESRTTVTGTFDAPFNRRAQRNLYRGRLIDYQAALRRLALLEDSIKLSVRRNLRTLSLNREQYLNDIASAALAFERVVSTELKLRLGDPNVQQRDNLEAQTAYIQSLSGVAGTHIGYISDRLQLFLDLELLEVGDNGFWDYVYDEEHQPMPFYQFPRYAVPAYGELHPCLKYSHEMRQMLCVPTGTSGIHAKDDPKKASDADLFEQLPPAE